MVLNPKQNDGLKKRKNIALTILMYAVILLQEQEWNRNDLLAVTGTYRLRKMFL